MPDNSNQPKEYDAVLGGQSSPAVNAAVLGGLAGVKQRLASPSDEVRIAALYDALKYGQAGLNVVAEIFKTAAGAVQYAAWNLLWNKTDKTTQQELLEYLPTFTFDVITVNKRGKEIRRIPSSARFFTEDLGDGIFMEMVSIPGGTFLMGSWEKHHLPADVTIPVHKVTVQPFFMGKYPVTQAQWQAVINISTEPNLYQFSSKEANKPVQNLSWHAAMEFCGRLAKKTGKTYRLPSEAEWEYACRAGTTTRFHFGDAIIADLANYSHSYQGRTDVGSFPPNGFGLYDMYGNVFEWCADVWHQNYHGAPSDGSVWESDGEIHYRVVRGGYWHYLPSYFSSAHRNFCVAIFGTSNTGFRVVCSSV